ncbi:MAG: transcriptional repressor LexA [Eubacteriales bacterium]|nr:transcriptional repressor LexA [Eubacteriales bacterium]
MSRRREAPEIVQQRIYEFICRHLEEFGFAPSLREIGEGAQIKSTSTVHNHLKSMSEDGLIHYRQGKRRAISLVDIPDEPPAADELLYDSDLRTCDIPLIGTITAGIPILAEENYETSYRLPEAFLGTMRETYPHFILRVRGDSMIDAGILDGDLVLIESSPYADEGDIIAALIGNEATVKRYGSEAGLPYLFPENESYDPIPFFDEDCRILGRVRSLFRIDF